MQKNAKIVVNFNKKGNRTFSEKKMQTNAENKRRLMKVKETGVRSM